MTGFIVGQIAVIVGGGAVVWLISLVPPFRHYRLSAAPAVGVLTGLVFFGLGCLLLMPLRGLGSANANLLGIVGFLPFYAGYAGTLWGTVLTAGILVLRRHKAVVADGRVRHGTLVIGIAGFVLSAGHGPLWSGLRRLFEGPGALVGLPMAILTGATQWLGHGFVGFGLAMLVGHFILGPCPSTPDDRSSGECPEGAAGEAETDQHEEGNAP